jgi:hypothetical protein
LFTNPIKHKSKNRNHKKVTKLGSKWNNSANAGTFYWNLNNATSNRNRNISRQLVNARNRRGKSKSPPVQYILCIPELPRRLAKKTAPTRGKLKIKLGCISKFKSLFSKVESSA